MRSRLPLLISFVALMGCATEPTELAVDVRTDFRPGVEFDRVVAQRSATGFRIDSLGVYDSQDIDALNHSGLEYLDGVRVAEYSGLEPGPQFVRVELQQGEAVVAERTIQLDLQRSHVTVAVLSRSCQGVVCEGDLSECVSGRCVAPGCAPESPELCGNSPCDDDGDCSGSVECAVGRCIAGECFETTDAGLCPNPSDICDLSAGCILDGECETSEREVPCETCGGSRIQICEAGEWTNATECAGGPCEPGDVEMGEACGNCGQQIRTCQDDCQWGDWSCGDQGECAAGDVENGGPCGACGVNQRTCTASCAWGEFECSMESCMPGDVEMLGPCGDCGTQQRSCDDACGWSAIECVDEGECAPGTPQSESRGCGACGEGTQSRTRMCDAACGWSAWSEWSACNTNANCSPGETREERAGCGNCGTRVRTRECDPATCRFGAFGAFSACSGQGECSPGAVDDCSSCMNRVCTASCQWGGCRLRSGAQCDHAGGTTFMCCGPGRSTFCLSTCLWSGVCDSSCSSCGC